MGKLCLVAVLGIILGTFVSQDGAKKKNDFTKPTIDIGCVVSDIDASLKFYKEAVGFDESGGFKVPGEFAAEAGLTDKPLDVKVLTLAGDQGKTQLKLMQIEGDSAKQKNDQINTTLGFSYITVFVKSTKAAMQRLKKANVKPLAKGPAKIPNTELVLIVVRDPDGNMIELLGPE